MIKKWNTARWIRKYCYDNEALHVEDCFELAVRLGKAGTVRGLLPTHLPYSVSTTGGCLCSACTASSGRLC